MPDPKYHERRAAEERSLADATRDSKVREVHRALASRHAYQAWLLRERDNTHGDHVPEENAP